MMNLDSVQQTTKQFNQNAYSQKESPYLKFPNQMDDQ